MGSRYMPHLDGLRCIAVLAVLYQHRFEPGIPIGSCGVILFYVISGYLITNSLLDIRDYNNSVWKSAKIFFSRRVMRLVPAYLVMLSIATAVMPGVRDHLLWYLSYTPNFRLAMEGRYISLTPTWSLSVEEQFYILWFFATILLSRASLWKVLPVLIVIAFGYRSFIFATGFGMAIYLLPACVDALAIGIALCLAERAGTQFPLDSLWTGGLCLALAIGLTLAGSAAEPVSSVLVPTLIAVSAGQAVWRARRGFNGVFATFFGAAPIVWLGRISYGIYLYHMIALPLVRAAPILQGAEERSAGGFLLFLTTTVSIAAASYYIIEQPLLALTARGSSQSALMVLWGRTRAAVNRSPRF